MKAVKWGVRFGCVLMAMSTAWAAEPAESKWTPCGWGGGGFYYSAAFSPSHNGVIYLGGDVCGIAKSEDHGLTWRMINRGIAGYGVFSIATDPQNPNTVYAATEQGLCKSTDEGEHWTLLPRTGAKELRITGEKGRSIRSVAVDPTNSNMLYAGSPVGKVYKSTDGGETWKAAYVPSVAQDDVDALRVQFGKSGAQFFGGVWTAIKFPDGADARNCVGIGVSIKGDGSQPQRGTLSLRTAAGVPYQSKPLVDFFQSDQWHDVILKAEDFSVDPDYAKQNPAVVSALPATLDWSTVARIDIGWVGNSPTEPSAVRLSKVFFAVTQTADGKAGTAEHPIALAAKTFSKTDVLQTYGNVHLGDPVAGAVFSVAISAKDPSLVFAATRDNGLVISRDGGDTWNAAEAPKKASSIAVSASDGNIIYASFFTDGVWKSTDAGRTWVNASAGISKSCSVTEVAVDPTNPANVYAIGAKEWSGYSYASKDGGQTWTANNAIAPDAQNDPTLPKDYTTTTPLSTPTNIAINPQNPKELYTSANWRSCLSEDGGATWTERNRGADISCIADIRFHGKQTYVGVMDEGALVSDNDGQSWRQLWPLKFDVSLGGHNWRIAVTEKNGAAHIVSTVSPWDAKYPPRVVVSDDGGKTYDVTSSGLPDYIVRANTMWGAGHPRGLAVDPNHPDVMYLGIDGDATPGKSGGGIFKSEDAGATWAQLPNQPASRRIYYGLAVDPTDSQRIFWAACGTNGGLHRTEDGGKTWKCVFNTEQWLWNVLVTKQGVIYCSGQNLWRSADHGATWKQLTKFNNGRSIVGLEADPRHADTIWIAAATWDNAATGGVYKTVDGGANWQDITGDLPFCKPQILRFNPATNELWAGWVGLFKIKQ